jgi:alpha-L-rhamnosidase
MCRFVEFCKHRSTPELLPPPAFHCFGDWLSINADTPKDLICTAYFAYSTRLTAQAAEVLGKTDDAARYRALFDAIKASFNHAFVGPDGRLKGNTQAGYVLALAVGLLDRENAQRAARFLVDDIQGRDFHLSTGFIGTKDLMLVLAKIGRNDVAGRLLHNDTFPSWGFSIRHGATSIWERWDGWTPDKGFQTPGMNSFAHYSFGAVYQWMVENLGGIRSAAPAYKQIAIAPTIDPRLTSARVAYQSIRGRIETQWRKRDGHVELRVTVPANTTATLRLPATDPAAVREQGHALAEAAGVTLVGTGPDGIVCELLSGSYQFEITGR